jgi:ATP-dependent Clp protease ATP-binding subunit ClpX
MLEIMFNLPSMTGVKECVINTAVVEEGKEPIFLYQTEAKTGT